jgi:hypothetical protein
MPLTVFDSKGIPASRRARIEGAVVTAGRNLAKPYEAWVAADLPPHSTRVQSNHGTTTATGFRRNRRRRYLQIFSTSEACSRITYPSMAVPPR